jgi:hypothetical protein
MRYVARMKWIIVAFVVLAGCSKSNEDRVAAEFRDFADRMCACDSNECKRQVRDDYQAWEHSDSGKLFAKARGAWIDEVEAKIKHGCR